MESTTAAASQGRRTDLAGSGAILVRDRNACIPLTKVLTSEDTWIVMLVPTPATEISQSPFQPLAESIANRHPGATHFHYYTPRHGFTSEHTWFVHHKHAKVVIVVIHGASSSGQVPPLDVAETALVACGERAHVILACDDLYEEQLTASEFPTIIRIRSFSNSDIEATSTLLFGQPSPLPPSGVQLQNLMIAPKVWPVDVFYSESQRPTDDDITAVHNLWRQSLPPSFALSTDKLGALLFRDGYAKHYVVREPGTQQILGFCATYYTFADNDPHRLIGSLAVIIVEATYQKMGIGLSLHTHALQQLVGLRGVYRLKLGSTFPRLLFGIPFESRFENWFRRRGWQMDEHRSGSGQVVSDWTIRFNQWPNMSLSPAGLFFRPCQPAEMDMVMHMVARETQGKNDGWYDQYARLKGQRASDIILGLEGNMIVASALTYTHASSSPVAEDLPWAANVGNDVGGVSCICIMGDNPAMRSGRSSVTMRLLNTCASVLADRGCGGMFLDGLKDSGEGFRTLGFQEWAKYREIWREI